MHKEYLGEYFICQACYKFSSLAVFIFEKQEKLTRKHKKEIYYFMPKVYLSCQHLNFCRA